MQQYIVGIKVSKDINLMIVPVEETRASVKAKTKMFLSAK